MNVHVADGHIWPVVSMKVPKYKYIIAVLFYKDCSEN